MTLGTLTSAQRRLHKTVYFINDALSTDLILNAGVGEPESVYINLAVLMSLSAGEIKAAALDGTFDAGDVGTADIADLAVTEAKVLAVTAGLNMHRCYRSDYSFAVDGGEISTIEPGSAEVPVKAIVTYTYYEVITQPVGVNATVSLGLQAAADILAATAITSLTAGVNIVDPAGALNSTLLANAPVKMTAARKGKYVIATTALTAGSISIGVTYMVGV